MSRVILTNSQESSNMIRQVMKKKEDGEIIEFLLKIYWLISR